ncbi:hypothetical protein P8452_20898 [Trifolium repens]|nr:hypothetical protein P8452_20898 [Trifolium repens]
MNERISEIVKNFNGEFFFFYKQNNGEFNVRSKDFNFGGGEKHVSHDSVGEKMKSCMCKVKEGEEIQNEVSKHGSLDFGVEKEVRERHIAVKKGMVDPAQSSLDLGLVFHADAVEGKEKGMCSSEGGSFSYR